LIAALPMIPNFVRYISIGGDIPTNFRDNGNDGNIGNEIWLD